MEFKKFVRLSRKYYSIMSQGRFQGEGASTLEEFTPSEASDPNKKANTDLLFIIFTPD